MIRLLDSFFFFTFVVIIFQLIHSTAFFQCTVNKKSECSLFFIENSSKERKLCQINHLAQQFVSPRQFYTPQPVQVRQVIVSWQL